jgi:hypothetical protein
MTRIAYQEIRDIVTSERGTMGYLVDLFAHSMMMGCG